MIRRKDYSDLAAVVFCTVLYYYLFARRFISREAIMSGDTQLIWSLDYLALYSVKYFSEFPWWDPTGLGGWQAHVYLICVRSYLNPFNLAPLLGFKLVSLVWNIDINSWLILQKTVYYFVLNLLGLFLIAKELIKSRLAYFFVLVSFTLSAIQFHGIRDSYMFAAMPTSLLFLYGFIRYSRNPDARNLLWLALFAAIFICGLSYNIALSAFYWVSLFVMFYLVLEPSLLSRSIGLVRNAARSKQGRALIAGVLALLAVALVAALSPILIDERNLIRVSGAHPIRYNVVNDFGAPTFGAPTYEIWSNLMTWMPFEDVHNSRLKFDPWRAGIDHRYIGLATLPLILVALVCRLQEKLVAALFLTVFICLGVLIYTYQNLAFRGLMESFFLFQNVRTMPGLLPRDGPSILMILLAGIGFDVLLRRQGRMVVDDRLPRRILFGGLAFFGAIALLSLLSLFLSEFKDIRHSLAHIGVYLGLYALMCVLLISAREMPAKRVLAVTLLVIVLADLSTSSSSYWDRGLVWTAADSVPQHRMPNPSAIGPINAESQNWPGTYRGSFHNNEAPPDYGKREWLVFALNPRLTPMLENWNASTRRMTAYPYFQFYTGGEFIPFERIHDVQNVPVLKEEAGELVERSGRTVVRINDKDYAVESGFAGFLEQVIASWPVRFSGWAIDEVAAKPAQQIAIFASGRLWSRGVPSDARPDVAQTERRYLKSGFEMIANATGLVVPQADRVHVRAFAILENGTARELRYSKDYSLPTPGSRVDSKVEARGVGPIYVHDERLAHNQAAGIAKAIDAPWQVTAFSLNRVKVKVSMPQDGLMMFFDNYHPYWRARLDDREVTVYRANFTYKVVQVPAGEHEIEWKFDPYPVRWAWLLFYALLAVVSLIIWRTMKLHKNANIAIH